jgi:hypothetical protein
MLGGQYNAHISLNKKRNAKIIGYNNAQRWRIKEN